MTATNHAVTGAFIGIAIANPIAIPIAFLSHFLLDALPHFGYKGTELNSKTLIKVYCIDVFLLLISSIYIVTRTIDVLLVVLCMLAAVLPDVISMGRYVKEVRTNKRITTNLSWYAKIHSKIQWGERPWGWIVELFWYLLVMSGVVKML